MIFIELIAPQNTELGEEILKAFSKKSESLTKEKLFSLVREHRVYFQNKPVGFLPFKIFKKGKVQIYLGSKEPPLKKEEVLYEDKWLIAINKAPGLPSQSSLKLLQNHAFSKVMCHLRNKKPFTSPSLFLLHRLDMDTSGVLLMSKKSSINKGMQDLFEKRKIQKNYLAISKPLEGSQQSPPEKVKSYLIRRPDKIHKFKFGSTTDTKNKYAKFSETEFKVLKKKSDFYFFDVSPKTGRSHQIRVHLKESGFPILGDVFYEGEKAPRLFLHAKSLKFKHPMTDEPLCIEAPTDSKWQAYTDSI